MGCILGDQSGIEGMKPEICYKHPELARKPAYFRKTEEIMYGNKYVKSVLFNTLVQICGVQKFPITY